MVRQLGASGSREMRKEWRMFGADLTEPGVLNHAQPSLKAELFGTLYSRYPKHLLDPKHFCGGHCECIPVSLNPQDGSFLPQLLRFPVAEFEVDTPSCYCLPI